MKILVVQNSELDPIGILGEHLMTLGAKLFVWLTQQQPDLPKHTYASHARCAWVKVTPTDHGYARPIEGVIPVVDLNKMEVIRVEDYGVVPLLPKDKNYTPEYVKNYRTDIKPLEIVQPEGPSFEVKDREIR